MGVKTRGVGAGPFSGSGREGAFLFLSLLAFGFWEWGIVCFVFVGGLSAERDGNGGDRAVVICLDSIWLFGWALTLTGGRGLGVFESKHQLYAAIRSDIMLWAMTLRPLNPYRAD